MNYENMIQRCIDGMDILKSHFPTADVAVHAHILSVPDSDDETITKQNREDLIEMGWTYHKDFGWLLPVLG